MNDNAAVDIFRRARELEDPAERARFLDGECGGDAVLRARVETLLLSEGETVYPDAASDTPAHLHERPGDRISHYTLHYVIGEGGFGSVSRTPRTPSACSSSPRRRRRRR